MGFSGMPKRKAEPVPAAGELDRKKKAQVGHPLPGPKPAGRLAWTVIKTVFRPGRSYHVLKRSYGGGEWVGFLALGDEAGRSDLHEDIGKTILCNTVSVHGEGWAALSRAKAKFSATNPVRIDKRDYAGVVLCNLSDGLVFVYIGGGSVVDVNFIGHQNYNLNAGDKIRFFPYRYMQKPHRNPRINAKLLDKP